MENPGIDPGTSHMLSERSTIWANPPTDSSILEISFFVISLRFCTDCYDEGLTLKTSADIFFTTLSIIIYINFSLIRTVYVPPRRRHRSTTLVLTGIIFFCNRLVLFCHNSGCWGNLNELAKTRQENMPGGKQMIVRSVFVGHQITLYKTADFVAIVWKPIQTTELF